MKITRERLEEILREEITAVAEGERDYAENETEHVKGARGPLQKEGGAQGHLDPVGKIVRDAMIGHKVGPVEAIPAAALAGIDPGNMLQNKQYNVKGSHGGQKYIIAWNDGNDQLFINLGNPSEGNLIKLDQYMQSAGYRANSSGAVPLEENAGVDAQLKEMLSLLEGAMQQEAPPVENDQRARELLDGFKNMLKPQERAEPSACATFLRQLADMAEREGGAPDAGTMPEPLPNN